MDWADEIASDLIGYPDQDGGYDISSESIAAALRKAKADGLRELAREMDAHKRQILFHADKIERGEA